MTFPAEDLQRRRLSYAEEVARGHGPRNAALIAAYARVPREHFVGPPPWWLIGGASDAPERCDDVRMIYRDVLVALSRERGINNGQPSLHACAIGACAPRPGERVLHIGAGTGYYSAILAELVGRDGAVTAYEIEADLAAEARRLLAHDWPQVEIVAASATDGALPSADVIYVCAAATHPPAAWLDALRPDGRLVLPLAPDAGSGPMLMIMRCGMSTTHYAARALMQVSFIGCCGARDPAASDALRDAIARQSVYAIRSLQRGTPPDASAWCVGEGWWLSTAEPRR